MAETETTVPMDDRELFEGAMADEPKPSFAKATEGKPDLSAEATAKAEADERPRDEQGRFAPKTEPDKPAEPVKAEQAKPGVEAQPQPEDAAQVPSWRLREVREAREAAERRATEAEQRLYAFQQEQQAMRQQLHQLQQPKSEPVDFFQNPEEAFQQRMSPFEQRQQALEQRVLLNSSRALAIAEHGKQAVTEMDQAIAKAMREGNPELGPLRIQLQASDDPVGMAMQWHKRTRLMEITGGDPDKYRATIREELKRDPKFQAEVLAETRAAAGGAQGNGSRPNIQLPPSLNRASGSGGNQGSDLSDADMGDTALFRHALDSPRR